MRGRQTEKERGNQREVHGTTLYLLISLFVCLLLFLGSATPTAATPTGSSITPRLSTQTGAEGALAYLLDCHERATYEERYSSKRSSASERKAVLSLCKECCVTHSSLLLQGYFGSTNPPAPASNT